MAAELRCARSSVVHVAVNAGLDVIDVPYLYLEDMEGMTLDAKQAKALGLSGRGFGSRFSQPHIATLADRKSKVTIVLKLADKNAGSFDPVLMMAFYKLPSKPKKSFTWDRGGAGDVFGTEQKDSGASFFCDLRSPWQRCTNENTSSLIRQSFSKKTCWAKLSSCVLQLVATQLSERPIKTRKFRTRLR